MRNFFIWRKLKKKLGASYWGGFSISKPYLVTLLALQLIVSCSLEETEISSSGNPPMPLDAEKCAETKANIDSLLQQPGHLQPSFTNVIDAANESGCLESNDEVAAKLAHLLAQGARNGLHEIPIEPYLNMARELSRSKTFSVLSSAHTALSFGDRDEDAIFLLDSATGASDLVIRSIVVALVQMCNSTAAKSLDSLATQSTTEQQEFIRNYRVKFQNKFSSNGWCDS